MIENDIKKNYQINNTNHLHVIINDIFYLLFYKNNTPNCLSEINYFLEVSKLAIIPIRPNRTFESITKIPYSKWSANGVKQMQ